MAEITFFATEQDCDILWDIIFVEMGLNAFPDPWFGDLPIPTLWTRADVAANLMVYPRVAPCLSYFLTSPDWTVEPLRHTLCTNNPNFAPHWCVSQREGGPSIHFLPAYGYPWHRPPDRIISGDFGDYPYYWSVLFDGETIKRPDELASTMKALRQRIHAHGRMVRADCGNRAIAMRGALEAYEKGVVLGPGKMVYVPTAKSRRANRDS
jgi:hypothetical protein